MSDPQLPARPAPPRRPSDVISAWLAWFGLARLLLTAAAVALVAGGLFWLVRTEPPSVDARLPVTPAAVSASGATDGSTDGSSSAVTLPGPTTTVGPDESPSPVLVHVAGAVHDPGLHELADGARVDDAIGVAGGARPDADLDGLNLAAPVVDGQRVYVPVAGEVDPAAVPSGGEARPGAPVGPTDPGPLDLNTATAEQFETLPGVGPATAAAIVDDRIRNGPFASVDDLDRVPGIGPAKLGALRDLVTV